MHWLSRKSSTASERAEQIREIADYLGGDEIKSGRVQLKMLSDIMRKKDVGFWRCHGDIRIIGQCVESARSGGSG